MIWIQTEIPGVAATSDPPDPSTPTDVPVGFDSAFEDSLKARPRVYCAECMHCRQFREIARSGRYILKARCDKGRWRYGSKEETCEIHRVTGRERRECTDYATSSDDENSRMQYLTELEDLLPDERHIYKPNGSFVDKTETMKWNIETT